MHLGRQYFTHGVFFGGQYDFNHHCEDAIIRRSIWRSYKHVPIILNHFSRVMAGVAKAIHVLLAEALQEKAWTLATSAA